MTKNLLQESTVDRWKKLAGINESRWGNSPYRLDTVNRISGPNNLLPNQEEKMQVEQIKSKLFDALMPLATRIASSWSPEAVQTIKNKSGILDNFPETEAFFKRIAKNKIVMPEGAGFLFLKMFFNRSGLQFDTLLGRYGDKAEVQKQAKEIEDAVRVQL